MKAAVGDVIVVRGPHLGNPDRTGQIVELRHADGTPPYVVRWSEDGHEGLYVPGSDARVEHKPARRRTTKR